MLENKDQPAFPDTMRAQPQSFINQFPERWPTGMTKREMVSSQLDVSKDMENWSLSFFEALMGCSIPTNQVDNFKWWAEAEAKIRVIKADALLTELSKS